MQVEIKLNKVYMASFEFVYWFLQSCCMLFFVFSGGLGDVLSFERRTEICFRVFLIFSLVFSFPPFGCCFVYI